MKVENNNKIISIGILLIGISLFYYFIIAPIIADSKLRNCTERVESGGYAIIKETGIKSGFGSFKTNYRNSSEEYDLCFKLYKK